MATRTSTTTRTEPTPELPTPEERADAARLLEEQLRREAEEQALHRRQRANELLSPLLGLLEVAKGFHDCGVDCTTAGGFIQNFDQLAGALSRPCSKMPSREDYQSDGRTITRSSDEALDIQLEVCVLLRKAAEPGTPPPGSGEWWRLVLAAHGLIEGRREEIGLEPELYPMPTRPKAARPEQTYEVAALRRDERTGYPAVDAVVDLVLSDDREALLRRVSLIEVPCRVVVIGHSSTLPCPPGAPVGAPVGVYWETLCQRETTIEGAMKSLADNLDRAGEISPSAGGQFSGYWFSFWAPLLEEDEVRAQFSLRFPTALPIGRQLSLSGPQLDARGLPMDTNMVTLVLGVTVDGRIGTGYLDFQPPVDC